MHSQITKRILQKIRPTTKSNQNNTKCVIVSHIVLFHLYSENYVANRKVFFIQLKSAYELQEL